jgi:hypothetical protein
MTASSFPALSIGKYYFHCNSFNSKTNAVSEAASRRVGETNATVG